MTADATRTKRTLAVMVATDATDEYHLELPSPEISPKLSRFLSFKPPHTEYSSEKTSSQYFSETTKSPTFAHVAANSPALVTAMFGEEEKEQEEEQENFVLVGEAAPAVRLNTKSTVEKRFADAQASARCHGNDPSLKWTYDMNDELDGATCGEVTFSREELLQLSTCWAGR